ncbi:MAG: conjugal transfer protein TraF [Elusimicrobia bacterium]|nr:conjugal transfer protein TraF [Elusimicrobiota bacterium]
MKKISVALFAVLILASCGLFAKGEPVQIEAVEAYGMGGAGMTVMGRYDVLYNPALLALKSGFHMRILELPISISNDIFKFYDFYDENQEELEDFDEQDAGKQAELLDEISDTVTDYKVRLRIGAVNPSISAGPFPFYGRDGKIWCGLGIYDQVDVGAKMNAGLLIPTVDFWARVDVQAVMPLAYKIPSLPYSLPGEAYAGINLKLVNRYKYEENRMSVLEFSDFDVDEDDVKKGNGYGWDWGLLYKYSEKWTFSYVMKDFLSTRIGYDDDTSEVIKTQVGLGSAYNLTKLITLAGEVRDIKFDDLGKATFFTKLYLGGELNLINILRLRAGLYQGYPSFGFGLLGFLNYAFYARELSEYPGNDPEWNHVFSLSIGF